MITEHAICVLPDDHPDWRHYVLRVQRIRSTDQWVVEWGGEYLLTGGPDIEWVMRRDNASQFSEAGALAAAEDLAPQLSIRLGATAADLLNRS